MLRALSILDDGELMLEGVRDVQWVVEREDSSERHALNRRFELNHTVRYPAITSKAGTTRPEIVTLRDTVADDPRVMSVAPDWIENGRSIWSVGVTYSGAPPDDEASSSAKREAKVAVDGRLALVEMVGTEAELIRMSASIDFATDDQQQGLARASTFAIGRCCDVMTGQVSGEGTLADGSKWRVVTSDGTYDWARTELNLDDTGASFRLDTANKVAKDAPFFTTIDGFCVVAAAADDAANLAITLNGTDSRALFIPFAGSRFRFAFIPIDAVTQTALKTDQRPDSIIEIRRSVSGVSNPVAPAEFTWVRQPDPADFVD